MSQLFILTIVFGNTFRFFTKMRLSQNEMAFFVCAKKMGKL